MYLSFIHVWDWKLNKCFHFAVKMWNFSFRLMEMIFERKKKKISLHLKSCVDWGQTINDQILSKHFQATISFLKIGYQNCHCPTDPVVIHVHYAVRLSPADTTHLFCMIWFDERILSCTQLLQLAPTQNFFFNFPTWAWLISHFAF